MAMNRREMLGYSALTIGVGTLGITGARAQSDSLITKAIPKSGEQVPVIGIGTNRYSVGDSEADRAPLRATLRKFRELGGTVIDTAPMYRKSESVLGELIAELDGVDHFFMATKCDRGGGSATDEQMRNSQRVLGYDVIDLMQIHSLRSWKDQLPVIREWQQEGRVRYNGVTTSRNNQHDDLANIMRTEQLDSVQLNYSLADRAAEKELLPLAAEKGIAVLVNLPLGRGRLFSAVEGVELPEWASEFDCQSWGQFFLKYVVSHPAVTCAIPGTTKEHHAIDNMGAAMGALPDAAMRKRQEEFMASL